jgi:uncharacterized Zn finger protein
MKRILNPNALLRLAGSRSFARGEDYFNRGLVRSLSERDGAVTDKVKLFFYSSLRIGHCNPL